MVYIHYIAEYEGGGVIDGFMVEGEMPEQNFPSEGLRNIEEIGTFSVDLDEGENVLPYCLYDK